MTGKYMRHRSLRIWISMLLLCVIMQSIPHSVMAAQRSAEITIAPIQGNVGQEVDVPVSVTPSQVGIAAYGLQLDYDKNILEAIGVTPSYGKIAGPACLNDQQGCFQSYIPASSGWLRVAWFDISGGDYPIDSATELFVVRFKIKGEIRSGSNPLSVDQADPEKLNMTDESGNDIRVRVTVDSAVSAKLKSLATSTGKLSPAFKPGIYAYHQDVGNEVSQTTITAIADDDQAQITINGTKVASGEESRPIDLSVGDNPIAVKVTLASGDSQTYTITVSRAEAQQEEHFATLSGLEISNGDLTPSFAPDRYKYSAEVKNEVTQLTVTPTAKDEKASITVNGEGIVSGTESHPIDLAVGDNKIDVAVTSVTGESRTYTIRVTRADEDKEEEHSAALASLEISEGRLSPSFSPDRYKYSAEVKPEIKQLVVTPTAEEESATIEVNGKQVGSGEDSRPIKLSAGKNRIEVSVTSEDGQNKTYVITVTRQEKEDDSSDDHGSSGSGGSHHGKDEPSTSGQSNTDTSKDQLVNKSTTSEKGEVTTVLQMNDSGLDKLLRQLDNHATIPLAADNDSDNLIGVLNGQMVKNMELKDIRLQLVTRSATYTVPAAQINIDQVSDLLGKQVNLADINIQLKISKADIQSAAQLQAAAQKTGYEIIVQPVAFTITWEYKNAQGEIKDFSTFVHRQLVISGGSDLQKITTGLRLNPDGTTAHVPTKIVKLDGKYYADIASMTNSVYTVVWHPKSFADMSGHWAQKDAQDMASRMVIAGVDDAHFAPQKEITRAQFAVMAVTALGLEKDSATTSYRDVSSSDWFYDAVVTASRYHLIHGYSDGTFRPNQTITRAEAVIVLAQAMKLAGLHIDLTEREVSDSLLSVTDAASIASWSRPEAAAAFKYGIVNGGTAFSPNQLLTRSEAAVFLRRILQKAQLIDES